MVSRITYIWLLLMALTFLSWLAGEGEILSIFLSPGSLMAALMLLAFWKVRLIVINFMELREARLELRLIFEAWMALACGILVLLYYFGSHIPLQ